jgi:short-subunit dehydrogenase
VTGASSGLGEAFAKVLAAHNYDLLLVARRKQRLDRLAESLTTTHAIDAHCLGLDLAEPLAPAAVTGAVESLHRPAAVLINSAGYYLDGDFLQHSWSEQATMLRVMLEVPTELIYALLPGMIRAGRGRVVTVASLGGFLHSTPHQTLYGPVKRYLIALSRTLATEYSGSGVTFTATCPGFTRTEMMDYGSTANAGSRLPAWTVADPDVVAAASWSGAERGQRVVVPGALNKAAVGMLHVLPTGPMDRLMTSAVSRLTSRKEQPPTYRKTNDPVEHRR